MCICSGDSFPSSTCSNSSCEAGESELNESQEERSIPPSSTHTCLTSTDPSSSSVVKKRKRLRKKKGVGLRKKLRTHIESVEEFNPEARDAQSAELDRIRRLELQRGVMGAESGVMGAESGAESKKDAEPAKEFVALSSSVGVAGSRVGVSSSVEGTGPVVGGGGEVGQVSSKEPSVEPIVIDSGSSDSDTTYQKSVPLPRPVVPGASSQGHAPRRPGQAPPRRQLRGKYDVFTPRADGCVLVNEGHSPSEGDVFLAPQIAKIAKPHQVRMCVCMLAHTRFVCVCVCVL